MLDELHQAYEKQVETATVELLKAKLGEVRALTELLKATGQLQSYTPDDARPATFYYRASIEPSASYLEVEYGQAHSRVTFGYDG